MILLCCQNPEAGAQGGRTSCSPHVCYCTHVYSTAARRKINTSSTFLVCQNTRTQQEYIPYSTRLAWHSVARINFARSEEQQKRRFARPPMADSGASAQESASSATQPEARRRKIRKGTRSCWECKRRKNKCTWSRNEERCDGCHRRGTRYISQEFPQEHVAS